MRPEEQDSNVEKRTKPAARNAMFAFSKRAIRNVLARLANVNATLRVSCIGIAMVCAGVSQAQTTPPNDPTIDQVMQESSSSILIDFQLNDQISGNTFTLDQLQVRWTNASDTTLTGTTTYTSPTTKFCATNDLTNCEMTYTGLSPNITYTMAMRVHAVDSNNTSQGWSGWTSATNLKTHPNFHLASNLYTGLEKADRVQMIHDFGSSYGDTASVQREGLFTFITDRISSGSTQLWTYSATSNPANVVRTYIRIDGDNLVTDDYIELEGNYAGSKDMQAATVTVTATLNSDTSVRITRAITMNVVRNRAPVFRISASTLNLEENKDHTVNIGRDFSLSDADQHTLTYAMQVISPRNDKTWILNATTGILSLATGKTLDYETTRRFVFDITAQDSVGATSNILRLTINVTDANDGPTIVPPGKPPNSQMHRNMLATRNFVTLPVRSLFTDPDGDRLCFSATQTKGTAWATFSLAVGPENCRYGSLRVARIPYTGHQGVEEVEFSVTATEENGTGTATATVSASIIYGLNLSPTIWGGRLPNAAPDSPYLSTLTIDENDFFVLVFTAHDVQPPRDRICFSLTGSHAGYFKLVNTVDPSATTACGYYGSNAEPGTLPNTYQIQVESKRPLDYEGIADGYDFNLVATDLYGAKATQQILIDTRDVPEPPKSSSIPPAYFLVGDGPKNYWLDDYFTDEADSDASLSYAVYVDHPSLVTARLTGATLELTPTSRSLTRRKQSTSVHVTATDSDGLSTSRTIDVTVKNSNTDPSYSVTSISFSIAETARAGANIGSAIRANDPDGDAIRYEIPDTNGAIMVDQSTGQLKVGKAKLDFETTDSYEFLMYAYDGYGGSDYVNVSIRIRDVNEAPVANKAKISEVSTIVGVVKADVVDAKSHFSDVDADDTNLRFDVSSNSISVATAKVDDDGFVEVAGHRIGRATITITAIDRGNLRAKKTFVVNVLRNNKPVVTGTIKKVSTQVKGSQTIDIEPLFSDDAADTLRYEVSYEDADVATASVYKKELTIRGRGPGTTKMTLTAIDKAGGKASIKFDVEVIDNLPPQVANPIADVTVRIGQANPRIDVSKVFEDDGDTFTLIAYTDDANVATAFILNDGKTLRIAQYGIGKTVGTLRARDSNGGVSTHDFNITVLERNDPPYARKTIPDVEISLDTARHDVSLFRVFNDENYDDLKYSVAASSDEFADVLLRTNPYKVRILPIEAGSFSITVTAEDDIQQTASVSFNVTIVKPDTNNAPTVANAIQDQTIDAGARFETDLNNVFSDQDGDTLSFEAESNNEDVATTQVLRSGKLRVFGETAGTATISVTATDTSEASVMDEFMVTVETAPSATNQIAGMTLQLGGADGSIELLDSFVDADGDILSFSAHSSDPNSVVVDVAGSTLTLRAEGKGSATVFVRATDPNGNWAEQNFGVTVGDNEIMQVASDALAGYGRTIIASVSSALEMRVANAPERTRENPRSQHPAEATLTFANQTPFGANAQVSDSVWSKNQSPDGSIGQTMDFSSAMSLFSTSGPLAFWSNHDQQSFGGEGFTGHSQSSMFGVDGNAGRYLLGMTLHRSTGEMSYGWGSVQRNQLADLSSVLPYVSYQPARNTTIWGIVGIGAGNLSTFADREEIGVNDLSMRLGMVGARRAIQAKEKYQLAIRADASVINMFTDDRVMALSSIDSTTTLVRAGVDGSYVANLGDVNVTPFGTLSVRHDGGPNSGSGLDVTGGVKLAYGMYSLELRGRTITAHSNEDFRGSGYSVVAAMQSSTDGTGLSLSIAPSFGLQSSDSGGLWGSQTALLGSQYTLNDHLDMARNLSSRISYGVRTSKDRFLVQPYIDVQNSSFGRNAVTIGGNLKPLLPSSLNLTMGLRLMHQSSLQSKPSNGVAITGSLKF